MNETSFKDSYRSLQLIHELEINGRLSQRELASRLGIAVGLVNSYLKNFVAKGYVRVKNYPRNRYAYLLTPKGMAEKSRLACQHFQYFTGLYTSTRKKYYELFLQLEEGGADKVAFCGVDEVAEIAYLSLHETGLELDAVFGEASAPDDLFGYEVLPLEKITRCRCPIVITSLKRSDFLVGELDILGVARGSVWQAS